MNFHYSNMKLAMFGALTLALKMDDAEKLSIFCIEYLSNATNTEKTVKKSQLQKNIKSKRTIQNHGDQQKQKTIW